ncbi:MAG: NYN domain-containing protein, partial [Bacteroidaceae bacterium]|nr:NYN domain-containing protein [Bacteroidaceae bacterium]
MGLTLGNVKTAEVRKRLEELKDSEIFLDVQQKGIDMKIGVDIATLALKRFVDTIVLFSGDS